MRRSTVLRILLLLLGLAVVPTARAGTASYPVVLIHGWRGHGGSFAPMISKLRAQGFRVLDFDPSTPGVQALSYRPARRDEHVPYVACKLVQPRIKAALARAGYDPDTQRIDVVAHSMGGLVARFLIEQPGADVDSFGPQGWYGDGRPDCDRNWAQRVDRLVMLGTPNHGTWEGWIPSKLPAFGVWDATGADMPPHSTFLRRLGYAMPRGEAYGCIGGNPSYGGFLRADFDGDGIPHGFDGIVPAESPYVRGCDLDLVRSNHGELLTQDAPLDDVINDLGARSEQSGGGQRRLTGTASVRLEYAAIHADHDPGTSDENRFDVWLDPDGGNDSYVRLGTIAYNHDAPFTRSWGNRGPTAPRTIRVSGTSAVVDVKVVVWESDPFASDTVGTAYFRNLTLSEDKDGQGYYQAMFPDAANGATDTLRISLNGVSARPAG